jgi:hypothetical protein
VRSFLWRHGNKNKYLVGDRNLAEEVAKSRRTRLGNDLGELMLMRRYLMSVLRLLSISLLLLWVTVSSLRSCTNVNFLPFQSTRNYSRILLWRVALWWWLLVIPLTIACRLAVAVTLTLTGVLVIRHVRTNAMLCNRDVWQSTPILKKKD